MVTVLGGLAEFERELISIRAGEGQWREDGAQAETQYIPDQRSAAAARQGRENPRACQELRGQHQHEFEARILTHRDNLNW